MISLLRKLALPALLSGVLAGSLCASQFDALYAFGDSLSDAGNVYSQLGIPAAPYSGGRFSNGPVWVQDLSMSLGLGSLTASQVGGKDYAWGSGETGVAPYLTSLPPTDLTGTTGQINQFLLPLLATHGTPDPKALYTIWIGSNDVADILANDPTHAASDIGQVVGNVDSAISTLASAGAKNFLILTVPDLGKTPLAIQAGSSTQSALSQLSAVFDTTLVNGNSMAAIPSLQQIAGSDGLNLYVLDTYTLLDSIIANGSAYGFTDTTDACLTGSVSYVGGTVCSSPGTYVFWDSQHPTAAADALLADAALNTLTATPEPLTLGLLGLGLSGVAFVRPKKA